MVKVRLWPELSDYVRVSEDRSTRVRSLEVQMMTDRGVLALTGLQ